MPSGKDGPSLGMTINAFVELASSDGGCVQVNHNCSVIQYCFTFTCLLGVYSVYASHSHVYLVFVYELQLTTSPTSRPYDADNVEQDVDSDDNAGGTGPFTIQSPHSSYF